MKYKFKQVFLHNLTHFSSYKKQSKLTIMNLHFNSALFSFKIFCSLYNFTLLKRPNEIPTFKRISKIVTKIPALLKIR